MRTNRQGGWVILGLLAALTAEAVPNAVVETVQAPAWVERGERRLPLVAGMALENRDRLLTGSGARAVVQLADGSAVKFGENVNVAVNAMKQDKNGAFSGAFDVSKGAFRLTTQDFRKPRGERAINVRAGSTTISLRGTDVWGRTDDERDCVVLLEGKIALVHPLGEAVQLAESQQMFSAAKGQAPDAVSVLGRSQMYQWALQTEPLYDAGTQQKDGLWLLRFGVFDKDEALALYDRLVLAGYAAKLRPLKANGGYRYELRLGQLTTEREALVLADRLVRELQVPAPSLLRR